MAELRRDRSSADESSKLLRTDLADTISAAADRLEQLSQRFGGSGARHGDSFASATRAIVANGGLRGALGHYPRAL